MVWPWKPKSRKSADGDQPLAAAANGGAGNCGAANGRSAPPLSGPILRQSSDMGKKVQERLVSEVQRKLELAASSEEKEDRDIVCGEVFADITGELNDAARESTGWLYDRWYEVLAPHYCKDGAQSEQLLQVCSQLWGQPFAAPIFALLLHQWLLVHVAACGPGQRLKHLNILVSGARQLFIGDVETGKLAFRPLYTFIAECVVLAQPPRRLEDLPAPGRRSVAALAAGFLPHYLPPEDLAAAARVFPAPSPEDPGGDDGADFLINCIVDILAKEIRAEAAVLRYLTALMALRNSPQLASMRTSTRIRLQGEVYALTQPGGPRYASRAVNRLAFRVLDVLFPHGRRTRRLINLAFRFLHPQEWPWVWWDTYGAALRAALRAAGAAWAAAMRAAGVGLRVGEGGRRGEERGRSRGGWIRGRGRWGV